MKKLLVRAARRVAPSSVRSLEELLRLAEDLRTLTAEVEEYRAVIERVRQLEDEVRSLKDEIDECRRDNLRIAELYDLTVERLGVPDPS